MADSGGFDGLLDPERCPVCSGSGLTPGRDRTILPNFGARCPACRGSGQVKVAYCLAFEQTDQERAARVATAFW